MCNGKEGEITMASLELKRKILEACKYPVYSLEKALPNIFPTMLNTAAEELYNAGYIDADIGKKYVQGCYFYNVKLTDKGIAYLEEINSFPNSSAS